MKKKLYNLKLFTNYLNDYYLYIVLYYLQNLFERLCSSSGSIFLGFLPLFFCLDFSKTSTSASSSSSLTITSACISDDWTLRHDTVAFGRPALRLEASGTEYAISI